jgi:hypothetical protein
MCACLYVEYLLFLSDLNTDWILSSDFQRMLKCKTLWKYILWEPSCSIRRDGRTDMTKLIVAFCNFAMALKKDEILRYVHKYVLTENTPGILQ